MTQKTKNVAFEKFLEDFEPCNLWAGEALEAQTRGCLKITSAQKWHSKIYEISAEKSFQAWQKKSAYDICKLQPPKLYKNVQELYCQAGKLFSAEI